MTGTCADLSEAECPGVMAPCALGHRRRGSGPSRRSTTLFGSVLALCVACGVPARDHEAPEGGGGDSADSGGPSSSLDTPGGTPDSGPTQPPGPPPVGGACPEGALQCPAGHGCNAGTCGPCGGVDDCGDLDACRPDGWCGACGSDAPCRAGETCLHGTCLPPVPGWNLLIAPADFKALVDNESKTDLYPCVIEVGGTTYGDGQVRLRGGSSLSAPKRSFRIEFPKKSAHPGYSRKINLRAEWNDPTYLRNALAAQTFRRLTTLPTFRTRFVRLSVNGEPYGLMSEVERVGEPFLEARGLPKDAPLYDADPPNKMAQQGIATLTPLPDDATYREAYDKQSGPDDYSDLRSFVEETLWGDYQESPSLDHTKTVRLREQADVDRLVGYLAVMGAIQGHDHVKKNYVVARLPSGAGVKWAFVPWDLDLTLGCLYDAEGDDTVCDKLVVDEWYDTGTLRQGMDPVYPTSSYFNMLIHLVVNDPELRKALKSRICEIFASTVWKERLPGMVRGFREHLAAHVQEDERDLNEDAAAFVEATDDLLRFLTERPAFLRPNLGCP
ncbi:MAG: hypothetical protein AMXMBFR64_21530 [Myxococcales bacterium]